MRILGVRIDNLKRKEILEKIEFFLTENKFHQIATVNPEFILQAKKDEEFASILNDCDLNIADGVGLWYAFIRNFRYLKCRFAGADLMYEILRIANRRKLSVYLAINKNGLSNFGEIQIVLKEAFPGLSIYGQDVDPLDFSQYKIQNTRYEILLCNFGAPHQEKFLNFVKNDTIHLAMGVGGSFDFVTGRIKRPAKFVRKLGLEWLWRLKPQWSDRNYMKKRWKRIFTAVIIFPIRVVIKR